MSAVALRGPHALLVACSALLTLAGCEARVQPRAFEIAGWYDDEWNDESHAVYVANAKLFTEVNPYWYDLGTSDDASVSDGSISERSNVYSAQMVADVHAHGDRVLPTIGDHVRGQIDRIVSDDVARQALLDNLAKLVQSRGYDGIDLNFEHGTSAAREPYAHFVHDLAHALHTSGKRLSLTVTPQSQAAREAQTLFDYRLLGATEVDRIKIMVYDEFDAGPDVPGPIGSVVWIRDVLAYAIRDCYIAPAKIQLAVHNYGWSWKAAGNAFELQRPFSTFSELTMQAGAGDWMWDAEAAEAWKQYVFSGSTYRAYVGNAESVAARFAIVEEYGLAGMALWVLGREDRSIYDRLCAHLGASCGRQSE